ncbi:MAG TPA: C13 family peptidase [Paraburkholderia sp.]|uniref:C13 family peptidase n=1 Tax=Paraburkholderia sp. TaxID=1926495 RepID=UPI002C5FED7C|nr:C13 family peptidase [Paraburkholderia sp.]HTR10113.1 C13 family peptidase [Paraburkholderia sp.]
MRKSKPTFTVQSLSALIAVVALSGCGELSPGNPNAQNQSMLLEQRQDAQAVQAATQATGRRVWFAGFAMNSTSTAFQNDMELVSRRLSELGGPVLKYEDSNGPQKDKLNFPFATPATLANAIKEISSHAGPDDIVVVFISTHGNRKILSVNVAHHELKPLTAAQLSSALAPLENRPTIVIIAACFSGSFLPELQAARRIVITSASGERASFGCQADSQNTFFTEALFAKGFDASKSLSRLMADAKIRIAQREHELRFRNSEPQMSVGVKLRWLAERPLKDWFQPGDETTDVPAVDPLSLLGNAGKNAYREYQSQPVPRAFVISSGGAGQYAVGTTPHDRSLPDDPAARALALCNRRGLADCRLYAIDDRVVWTGN